MIDTTTPENIRVELPKEFHSGWNKFPGFTTDGRTITIEPTEFFYRYTNPAPTWRLCDWAGVRDTLLTARETPDTTAEQLALDHIREHGHTTTDPAEVLATAWEVYSFLFRDEHLADPAIQNMGVTPEHLRALREMATIMALNRVEDTGAISNVNPAWMFGIAVQVAHDLTTEDAETLDELYHGGWFNEPRRLEQVLAHAALGGRLVHGCQSSMEINMAGGAVVPHGADINKFRADLATFRDEWVEKIRACA